SAAWVSKGAGACRGPTAGGQKYVLAGGSGAGRHPRGPVRERTSPFDGEVLPKPIRLSHTVAMQLAQYEAMVRRDARADPAHVEALLRLVGRRPDADLVFADAERRAARRAVGRLVVASRVAAPAGPRRLGHVVDVRAALAEALAALGADALLLYDFRHVNPVAERILGPTGMGTRRLFVLLPRSGKPVAVAHRIELQPLAAFPGEVRAYGSWRELHSELQALARGRTLAMEVSPQDAVPYLDRVPHGVVQLLEGFGARVVSSAPLVSRFAARWSAAEAEGHRRAARALAEIARDALTWAGRETARGAEVREVTLQQRVVEGIGRAGLVTDHPPIAA